MKRNGSGKIEINKRKYSTQHDRLMVIHTAKLWGWQDASLSGWERAKIARAAWKQVAYDAGYKHPLSHSQMKLWHEALIKFISEGGNPMEALSPNYKGSKSYCDTIEGTCHSKCFDFYFDL